MVFISQYINVIVIIITCNIPKFIQSNENSTEIINPTDPDDWRSIEALGEENPYIVALLSDTKDYICTGSVINKDCVLTSGHCISLEPKYVAVNTAVYHKKLNNNTIFNIASTIIHGDYIFQMNTEDPNITRMHSNIGLVYVDRPYLEYFINVADLGDFYASELKDKELTVIGFGSLGSSNLIGLQYQIYRQTFCLNPKWFYCVCGIEPTKHKTYISAFGKGGPVLFEGTLVGISAAPCGTLFIRNIDVKYNVFTLIGPYLPWIEKSLAAQATNITLRSKNNSVQHSMFLKHFCILIMISTMFS